MNIHSMFIWLIIHHHSSPLHVTYNNISIHNLIFDEQFEGKESKPYGEIATVAKCTELMFLYCKFIQTYAN